MRYSNHNKVFKNIYNFGEIIIFEKIMMNLPLKSVNATFLILHCLKSRCISTHVVDHIKLFLNLHKQID